MYITFIVEKGGIEIQMIQGRNLVVMDVTGLYFSKIGLTFFTRNLAFHGIVLLQCVSEKYHSNARNRPDAIRQCDANFRFSTSFNFNPFLFFSNLRKDFSNWSYLVHMSNQISFH